METAEHTFITREVDAVLRAVSRVRLLGVSESDRRRFDYAVTLLRDCSRPLIAQVLWTHVDGAEKDLRTLLHDRDARIKLYLVRDSVRVRQRLDEIITSYRQRPDLAPALVGLRLVFLPHDFDADRASDQGWMAAHLQREMNRDILFNIVFGNLTSSVCAVFADHGGPNGLKYAILDEITEQGLDHTPTFKQRLGYTTTSPIREALAMLSALGLIRRIERTVLCVPTIRGRVVLDLTRLLLFESRTRADWSPETRALLSMLGFPTDVFYSGGLVSGEQGLSDRLAHLLISATQCARHFGRDLLRSTDPTDPRFYSEFDWRRFAETVGGKPDSYSDPDALFFV